jgi:hypothetical protein
LARVIESEDIHESSRMRIEKAEFLKAMNPLLYFVEEKMEFPEDPVNYDKREWHIEHNRFYHLYATWCLESGLRPMNKIKLFGLFRHEFPAVKDDTYGANKFVGIRARDAMERPGQVPRYPSEEVTA